MDEKNTPERRSFFQDTQKLTFALGLSWGLAVMAIVGMVLIAVNNGNGGTSYKATNTPTVATNTDSTGQPVLDPVQFASAIGLDSSKFTSCLNGKKWSSRVDRDVTEGSNIGVNGTPTSFINGTAISGALPYTQIKSAIDAALSGTKGTTNVPAVRSDDHVRGSKNAKVLIVEYSDFQCPYCQAFNPTVQQALTEYGDKVALVYRHFPLESIHPYARSLAEGSECAEELGGEQAFWGFHDAVFGRSS